MRAIKLKLAPREPGGYGTFDLYLRAIARILSGTKLGIECSPPQKIFRAGVIASFSRQRRDRAALRRVVFLRSHRSAGDKMLSSVNGLPSAPVDAFQRNCSGRRRVTPVGFLAKTPGAIDHRLLRPRSGQRRCNNYRSNAQASLHCEN